MIVLQFLHQLLLFVINTVSYLPAVTVLPFGMSNALLTGANYWYSFLQVFWPLQIVWTCVLWYALFKVALLTLRIFFGDRTPDAS